MDKTSKDETDPSFGVVRISRVTGQRRLFDSPFDHQHFLTLSISRAYRTRDDLHNTKVYPKGELIEVSMSEVQFANLITSLNMGQGTPCTISHLEGKIIKEPAPDQTRQTFAHEAREHFTDMAAMAKELEALTNKKASELKAEQRERMKFLALKIHQALTCDMDFFHEQFVETMEKAVSAAKAEIQAHVLNVVQQTGLTALKNMNLEIADKSEG